MSWCAYTQLRYMVNQATKLLPWNARCRRRCDNYPGALFGSHRAKKHRSHTRSAKGIPKWGRGRLRLEHLSHTTAPQRLQWCMSMRRCALELEVDSQVKSWPQHAHP
mmetsp:Transcript_1240/g.2650  ORF Transcript_1240/g.2650 Transcript_1240/m.2650 type:complete len:107 (-) Transcript_1240:1727-2047(-)